MLLEKDELLGKYYKRAVPCKEDDVDLYLSRANSFCIGYIGGVPPFLPGESPDRQGLKVAVAMCWEVMARGETDQVDEVTGNITNVAPPTAAVKTADQYAKVDQFAVIREMLRPYKIAYEDSTSKTDRGVKFL